MTENKLRKKKEQTHSRDKSQTVLNQGNFGVFNWEENRESAEIEKTAAIFPLG